MSEVLRYAPVAHSHIRSGKPTAPVAFAGRDILKQYGLNPNLVDVDCSHSMNAKQKRQILEKMVEAHEHALKSKAVGNFSDHYPSYNIQMGNGRWQLATTVENSRETTMCAERSAIIGGINRVLGSFSLKVLKTLGGKEKAQQAMQVKLLVAANQLPPGNNAGATPCADCSQWLNAQTFVRPDTEYAFLENQPTGKALLHVWPITKLYPMKGKQKVSFPSNSSNFDAEPGFSPNGRRVFNRLSKNPNPVTKETLGKLMQAAQVAYVTNATAMHSGKNAGAAMLFDNGQITSGQRFDITKRWSVAADILALVKGTQAMTPPADGKWPKVIAVAYYGQDEEAPSMESIGRLAQVTWGDPEVLLLTLEKDKVKVRTTADYMTRPYISRLTSSDKK